jgi:selenocysteine lyase/cysteine desulfurase
MQHPDLPGPPPPVVLGDAPSETAGADKIATYFYQQARRKGKPPHIAASIARGQALNFLNNIGIFKPQPRRGEL